jgi:cytoskeletal protein RodZ
MKLKKPSTKLQSPKKPVKHAVKKARAIPKLLWPLTPWTICFIGVVILFCGSVGALFIQYDHSSTTPTKSTSAASSNGSDCLSSYSGCPSPSSPSTTTPTPTSSTPSTPTTTKPKSSTPTTSYPTVIDGMVWASSTCHYPPGYGEASYRDELVNSLQNLQSGTDSSVESEIIEAQEDPYPPLPSQQTLNSVNSLITIMNSGISTDYAEYVSDVASIGCATTIDTTNVPQVQPCTDLSGTSCIDAIYAISIPSLE